MTSRMISFLFPEAAVLLVLAQGCALTPPVKNSPVRANPVLDSSERPKPAS